MKWTWKDTGACAVIAVVVAAFFFRLFWPVPQIIITPDFGQSDAVSALATKFFYSAHLAQHRIPLWTSAIGGGYPIFALGTMAAFFLPNLAFFSVLPPVTAYNLTLVFSVCFMGWGMYVWIRLMGYRRVSCLFGSITAVLSGYTIAQLTHITIVQSYSMFPWLAALTLRLAQKKSWWTVGWFILLLSQQIFIGFPQCVFITLLFLVSYWIWLKPKNMLFFVAVSGGCLAAAVQILPSLEYLKTLVTAQGFSLQQASFFSYPFKHLVTLVNPFALGNPAAGTYPHFTNFEGSIFWENTAYIGSIPLLCLTLAAWKKISIKPMIFFIFILAVSFLLMTGRHSPLYLVYSFWPFNIFRVPSRFIWLFDISLIVMSVYAFNRIIVRAALLVVFIHTVSLFIIWSPYHLLTPAREWLTNPPITDFVDHTYQAVSIGAERLYTTLNPREADASYFLRNTLTPDKSLLWGVPQIGEYTGRTIRRSGVLNDFLNQEITVSESHATVSAKGRTLLTLLSVKNVISALPLTQEGFVPKTQIEHAGHTIDLYENPDALPALYFAKEAIPVHTVEDAVAAFASDAFIPGDTVLVEFDATSAANLTRGYTYITSSEDGRIRARVNNPNDRAILVFTQTYYPGWHALIDTQDAPIFPVNIKHIGLMVPAGNHTVEFRYLPDSFVYGAWISASALGATVVLMAFGFLHSLWSTRQKAPVRVSYRRRSRDRSRRYNR